MGNWWTRHGWIWSFYALAMANLIVLGMEWTHWSWDHRLLGMSFLVLMLHVSEEWFFPGGFHVQYNTLMHSHAVDRYPMDRLTDSITVVVAMALGLLIVPTGGRALEVAMGTFGCLEIIMHTLMGITMHRILAPHGKRTIYGPGSITAYCAYLPLAVALFTHAAHSSAGLAVWLSGIAIGILYASVTAFTPELLLKNPTSQHPYRSFKYFHPWETWIITHTNNQPDGPDLPPDPQPTKRQQ